MKTVAVFFASSRYWKDESVLQRAYSELAGGMPQGVECALVKDTAGPNALPEGSCLIAVPMSGAVQRAVLAAAGRYEQVALYGAYIRGNAPDVWCDEMLRCNAAPTLMDSWAVLRRRGPGVRLALNAAGLADTLKLWEAYYSVKDATLLMIGKTEPWVISNASSLDVYERRFGLTIRCIEQAELAGLYRQASREQAQPYYEWFCQNSTGCKEPTDAQIWDASRMAWALLALLDRYKAKGAALACFNLLSEGTTACLGVSYLNDCTPMVAACEGDMDSAVTMLLNTPL